MVLQPVYGEAEEAWEGWKEADGKQPGHGEKQWCLVFDITLTVCSVVSLSFFSARLLWFLTFLVSSINACSCSLAFRVCISLADVI